VVLSGQISDEALSNLSEREIRYVSGHIGPRRRSATLWVQAEDEAAAEALVRSQFPSGATIESIDRLPYWVSMGVPEEDASALEHATAEARHAAVGGVITKEPSDGFAEVIAEVVAETDLGALRKAFDAYRALREDANLPPAEPVYSDLQPPWPGRQPQPAHAVPLEQARDLLDEGKWDLAVVVAQTALEVYVAQVVSERLQERQLGGLRAYITGRIRAYTLNDDPTRMLWKELTDDDIDQAPVWTQYKLHLVRRNAIVHRGHRVGRDEARSSVEVVEQLISHVDAVRARVRGTG
jgi:hypothetical protein